MRKVGLFLSVLLAILGFTISQVQPVYAMNSDQRLLFDNQVLYFNFKEDDLGNLEAQAAAGNCTPGGVIPASFSTSTGAVDNSTTRSTGLQPPYILEQFAIETLKSVAQKKGAPESDVVTEEHVVALVAFMFGEGGDINNSKVFNPLNTTYYDAALVADPSYKGIQVYKSFDAGVEATARTITGQYQSRLADVLTKKDSTGQQFMEALTYFNRYPGNHYWAIESQQDPNGYYQQRLSLLTQTRNNYADRASIEIGTPALEQKTGAKHPEKLQFHPAGSAPASGGGTTSGGDAALASTGCSGGGGVAGGGIGVGQITFPLVTTKEAIKTHKPYPWCWQSQTNCHHDYNAADIMSDEGTQVIAAAPGVVQQTDSIPGKNADVTILGDDKNVYFYQHMAPGSLQVTKGQHVTAATPLGKVGNSAAAFGTDTHLHFDMEPPPATFRANCSGAACSSLNFLNVQPALISAFNNLPENGSSAAVAPVTTAPANTTQ